MNEMVNIKINDKELAVPKDYTVLKAAKEAGIHIPTLCFLEGKNNIGACRMCLIEIKGGRTLQTACTFKVYEGLEVYTNTKKVRDARKVVLELTLSNHDKKCLTCTRSGNCELQTLSEEFGIEEIRYEGENIKHPIDDLSPSIVRDPNKCVLCKRCVSVCKNIQAVSAIGTNNRGFESITAPAFDKSLALVPCTNCGQCIKVCPVGALYEKNNINEVWDAINNDDLHVVVQVAPAVRAALGEEFGMPVGTKVTGKMVAALKELGFDGVFDTNTSADLTIMEEGTELLDRIKNGQRLPLITSCCPAWIKFAEHNYSDLLDNLSSCKSPQQMFGAVLKTYYPEKINVDPKNVFVVSVMPCTAKKFENKREEMKDSNYRDVDVVITTRELAKMIKQAGIDFKNIQDSQFDNPLGEGSGAGLIFGATGGVMEAALRTVADILGEKNPSIEYEVVRGIEGIKEASVKLGDITVNAAVVHGLGNVREVLEKVKNGEKNYHFIEIMACPGGCVDGGGQPIVSAKDSMDTDARVLRAKALYDGDKELPIRKSHENPVISKIYEEFLEKPGSHKAHKLFHTKYQKKEKYTK